MLETLYDSQVLFGHLFLAQLLIRLAEQVVNSKVIFISQ